jgi:hypothetical protein
VLELSKTVSVWERFLATFECLFENPSQRIWLRAIKENFEALKAVETTLQAEVARCDEMTRDVSATGTIQDTFSSILGYSLDFR